MSAKELGQELGRNKEFVDRRENGEYDYTRADLLLIAKLTGAPEEFMLDGTGWTAGTWQTSAKRAGREIAGRAARARKAPARSPGPGAEAQDSAPKDNPSA